MSIPQVFKDDEGLFTVNGWVFLKRKHFAFRTNHIRTVCFTPFSFLSLKCYFVALGDWPLKMWESEIRCRLLFPSTKTKIRQKMDQKMDLDSSLKCWRIHRWTEQNFVLFLVVHFYVNTYFTFYFRMFCRIVPWLYSGKYTFQN